MFTPPDDFVAVAKQLTFFFLFPHNFAEPASRCCSAGKTMHTLCTNDRKSVLPVQLNLMRLLNPIIFSFRSKLFSVYLISVLAFFLPHTSVWIRSFSLYLFTQ